MSGVRRRKFHKVFPVEDWNVIAQIITGVQNYYYNQQCLWHHTENQPQNDTHFPVLLQTWILSDKFRKKYTPSQRSACSHWCNLRHLAQHRAGLPSQPHNVESSSKSHQILFACLPRNTARKSLSACPLTTEKRKQIFPLKASLNSNLCQIP